MPREVKRIVDRTVEEILIDIDMEANLHEII